MLPFFSIPEIDIYARRFNGSSNCVFMQKLNIIASSSPFSVFFLSFHLFSIIDIKYKLFSILVKQSAC